MLLIELHYFPCIAYFFNALEQGALLIEANEHFQKQSYRNRCYILTSNKIDCLSVPIVHEHKKILIKDVRIAYREKWQNRHWRAIESSYRKAPFFDFMAEDFKQAIYRNHPFLFDLSLEILEICQKYLALSLPVWHTDKYIEEKTENITDLRGKIVPGKDNGIIPVKKYSQLFGEKFIENLSVMDLLFNQGNQSGSYLRSLLEK